MIARQLFDLDVPATSQSNLALYEPNEAGRARLRRSAMRSESQVAYLPSRESTPPHEIQLALCRPQLFAAFKLVYQEYLRTGLVRPNHFQMRATPYHLLPTTDVIIAAGQSGHDAACTVSLVGDGRLGLPIENEFAEQVNERRAQGISLGEVTSLADNRDAEATGTSLVLQVMSFMAQRAKQKGIDELLITVHPHHAKFYQRFIGFEVIGEERSYGAVLDKPAVPLALDLSHLHVNHPRAYQRFFGKPFPAELFVDRSQSPGLRAELRRIVAACESANSTPAPSLAKVA